MNTKSAIANVVVASMISAAAFAQDKSPYEAARQKTDEQTAAWKKQFAGRDDVLIAPGVLADRGAKKVTLLACATGIGAGESVEFFVTPLSSGKDYESLCATFATPSDVIAGLKFIGLSPGQPVSFEKNRQWPRGPRVIMTLNFSGKSLRVEDCVENTDTKATLPRDGLVFTGSYTFTDDAGKSHVAADEIDSKSLASDFNDSATVLDVPRRAPQGIVYGFQKPAEAFRLKQGEPVTIELIPAAANAAVAEHNILIAASAAGDKVAYDVSEAGKSLGSAADLPHLLGIIAGLADGKSDWFTTAKLDPQLRVEDVRKLYAVLQAVEKDRGVKLDPPLPGDLFYRAFFPEPGWRDRESRLGEPWELFLTRADGTLTARLERAVVPDNASPGAKKVLQAFPVDSPAAFAKAINDNASQWSKAAFVYPPADLSYGELLQWIGPALPTCPQIFVFPAAAPATQKAG